jgi:hypothetical protein
MIKEGALYKRYDAKNGKTPPVGFIPAQDPDAVTGHWPGWLTCNEDEPADKWFIEGFRNLCEMHNGYPPEGTYELVGPRINGNKDGFTVHGMIPHGKDELQAPRTFLELKAFFAEINIEGIVWHHSDGSMVKIKKKDFGYKW